MNAKLLTVEWEHLIHISRATYRYRILKLLLIKCYIRAHLSVKMYAIHHFLPISKLLSPGMSIKPVIELYGPANNRGGTTNIFGRLLLTCSNMDVFTMRSTYYLMVVYIVKMFIGRKAGRRWAFVAAVDRQRHDETAADAWTCAALLLHWDGCSTTTNEGKL